MRLVNLEDPMSLPEAFVRKLRQCDKLFSAKNFLEQIRDESPIRQIISEINNYCLDNRIVGYHYTRAIEEELRTHGLLVRTGEAIRSTFMERHGARFTAEQRTEILDAWGRCYDAQMIKARDNRIYFNFTRNALSEGGADLLIGNYGGEQIYFYIDEIPGVGEILSSIGTPMIVKCSLLPSDLKVYISEPWGQISVSAYHRTVNTNAHQVDQDGHQIVPVLPENIEILSI